MKMYELLDKSEKWTKGALARDSREHDVDIHDEKAVSWCIVGAFHKCYDNDDNAYEAPWPALMQELGLEIVMWNNAPERTWQDVYDLCKKLDL